MTNHTAKLVMRFGIQRTHNTAHKAATTRADLLNGSRPSRRDATGIIRPLQRFEHACSIAKETYEAAIYQYAMDSRGRPTT